MARATLGLAPLTVPRKRGALLLAGALIALLTISLLTFVTTRANALSLWSASATPAVASDPDAGAIEVGVKFRSSVATTVTGVKFYKGSGNTGTHTGSLWSATGTRLATVTFANETASGWQTASFATPVAIAANTTYVISYFAPNGHYSVTEGYFANSAATNGTLTALQNGTDGGNGVYTYGASSFPSNSYNASNYWVDVVTGGGDTTAPTGSITTPTAGQTVTGTTPVTATATDNVGVASVQFKLDGQNLGSAVTAAPYTTSWNTTTATNGTHTLTAVVTDTSDNSTTTASVAVTVSNQTTPATSASLWANSATPAVLSDSDATAVELGVKFRSSVATNVTGVKFYKSAANTGTHTGSLWSASGTRLATVTFTNETASGWQTATFATPVAISANTTYVISYHAPNGHYSANSNYFGSAAYTNGTLTALQNGTDGGNGVYTYGASNYPSNTYGATNYWVDVITNTAAPADTTAPQVTATTPLANALDVAQTSTVTATFSEALNPATVTTSTVTLKDSDGASVPATVSYSASEQRATLTPQSELNANATYTATITTGIKDTAGNALAASYSWSFTTKAAAVAVNPLAQGHGGPILVVTKTGQPFSEYYSEILRAEGLNSFSAAEVSTLTSSVLANYSTVILGDMALTTTQVAMLSTWVNNGGSLIAMHPDAKLAGLLGLTSQTGVQADKYLKVNTAQAPGTGITSETMQYHGSADTYTANSGTTTVATLYSTATTATTNPAVTMRKVGNGYAAAFTYDLARSIVYTHQGNPAWSGDDRDGNGVIRPNDLFYGNKAGDAQADYVDLNKVAIPQADEQQRLLANLIAAVNYDKQPLPRLGYFPYNDKAIVVLAADDHSTGSGTTELDYMINQSAPGCVVADWECIRSTSLMYANTPMTDAQAAAYYAQGFDFGVHTSTGCSDWTPESLAAAIDNDVAGFHTKYTSLPAQNANRLHCIAWSTYTDQAKVEAARGMRIDLNYYYWPGSWVQDRPGYMTGSGMNMRFADTDGTMIDTYQLPSHLVNESGQTWPQNIDTMLERALGPLGYYGALATHYDYSDSFDRQLIQSAKAHNVRMVSTKQMLDWTDGRNNSYFTLGSWAGSTYSFSATMDARTRQMGRVLLPADTSKGVLQQITLGGAVVPHTIETMKGVSYAVFTATTGTYSATYGADTVAPTVTNTTPAANATGVAVGSNVTVAFSEPLDPSTVNSTTVQLSAGGTTVPATVNYVANTNSIVLSPASALASFTSYTVTITTGVKDAHGVALAATHTSTFTTGTDQQSVWAPAAQSVNSANDGQALELGLQFSATKAGSITGVQFYKSASDTQTSHTVTLWNANGIAMATATTSNETASGWQVATFATPVAIQAGTTYTASYLAPTGQYSYTSGGLATSVTTGALTAQANGGVYVYGGGYPTASFGATNYWVDVVFKP